MNRILQYIKYEERTAFLSIYDKYKQLEEYRYNVAIYLDLYHILLERYNLENQYYDFFKSIIFLKRTKKGNFLVMPIFNYPGELLGFYTISEKYKGNYVLNSPILYSHLSIFIKPYEINALNEYARVYFEYGREYGYIFIGNKLPEKIYKQQHLYVILNSPEQLLELNISNYEDYLFYFGEYKYLSKIIQESIPYYEFLKRQLLQKQVPVDFISSEQITKIINQSSPEERLKIIHNIDISENQIFRKEVQYGRKIFIIKNEGIFLKGSMEQVCNFYIKFSANIYDSRQDQTLLYGHIYYKENQIPFLLTPKDISKLSVILDQIFTKYGYELPHINPAYEKYLYPLFKEISVMTRKEAIYSLGWVDINDFRFPTFRIYKGNIYEDVYFIGNQIPEMPIIDFNYKPSFKELLQFKDIIIAFNHIHISNYKPLKINETQIDIFTSFNIPIDIDQNQFNKIIPYNVIIWALKYTSQWEQKMEDSKFLRILIANL